MHIDRQSLLAEIAGTTLLGDAEDTLRREGLTLGLESLENHRGSTLDAWLAAGALGAPDPWRDPADHLLAGMEATLANGETLSVRPAPRRAVGPDLVALVIGMRARFATVTSAWIRIHPVEARQPATAAFVHPRNPPLSAGETALIEAVARELARR